METCVCFVLSWCFLVNRNKKLVVLTAVKVSCGTGPASWVFSPQRGGSIKWWLQFTQFHPFLFFFSQRRSCCLALTSLIIAFDRVVALVSSQAGFLHVLYKLKDGDAVNSSGVSVSQEGRLEAEPSQSLIFLLAVLWRGCRKVWEEQKSKQVSGLEVRLKGAGRFTAAVGGHNPLL